MTEMIFLQATDCRTSTCKADKLVISFLLLSLLTAPTSCFGAGAFFRRRSRSHSSDKGFKSPLSKERSQRKIIGLLQKPLRENEQGGDGGKIQSDRPEGGVSTFEDMVRKATGMKDYRFGSLTKSAISSTTHAVEEAVQTVTGNEDYKFGDITKGAVSKATKTGENALAYAEYTLSLMREANIHQLVELTRLFWTQNLDDEQRKEWLVVFLNVGALGVLAYNFVSNVMDGLVGAAAWTMVSGATGKSPLTGPALWSRFLQTQSSLNMIFGGPFLPVRVAITTPWFFRYRQMVTSVEVRSPMRLEFPVLNRVVTLFSFWVVLNLMLTALLSLGVAWACSLWTGVPIFPATVG